MQKRIIKLGLALSMLVGSFVGISPREAVAQTYYCQDICCTASCSSVRDCYGIGGRCTCSATCRPADI